MALSNETERLGDLLDLQDDNEVLERLKILALEQLPSGWKEWPVSKQFTTGLLKLEAQTMNKLRFVLPTIGIAKAFSPDSTSLSEKAYRRYKGEMLNWPFCRGLIIRPPELAIKIRGSALQHELVLQAIISLKCLFLSRKEASLQLYKQNHESDSCSDEEIADSEDEDIEDDDEEENTIDKLRPKRKQERPSDEPAKKGRWKDLDARQRRIESVLESLLEHRPAPSQTSRDYSSGEDSHEILLRESSPMRSTDCSAPRFACENDNDFSFEPAVKEQEPLVREPLAEIKAQGMNCQKFGESSWNKIRYCEAQKKLQAGSIFAQLQVNSQLSHITPKGSNAASLAKMDAALGILCHGLLMQRKALQDNIFELAAKYPSLAEDLKKKFGDSSSNFRIVSDDLLQYVCGKRAKIIEFRRRLYEPLNANAAQILKEIPPSGDFLFDESQIRELYNHQDFTTRSIFRYKKPSSSYPNNKPTVSQPQSKHFKSTSSGKRQNEARQRRGSYEGKVKYERKQSTADAHRRNEASTNEKRIQHNRF